MTGGRHGLLVMVLFINTSITAPSPPTTTRSMHTFAQNLYSAENLSHGYLRKILTDRTFVHIVVTHSSKEQIEI